MNKIILQTFEIILSDWKDIVEKDAISPEQAQEALDTIHLILKEVQKPKDKIDYKVVYDKLLTLRGIPSIREFVLEYASIMKNGFEDVHTRSKP